MSETALIAFCVVIGIIAFIIAIPVLIWFFIAMKRWKKRIDRTITIYDKFLDNKEKEMFDDDK